MGTNIYVKHGLQIRRIALGHEQGVGFEIHTPPDEKGARLTLDEFRKMVLDLVDHLREAGDLNDKLEDARFFLGVSGQKEKEVSMEKRFSALRISVQKILEYLEEAVG